MKIKTAFILLTLTLGLLSCNKDDIDTKFYERERNVFFEEYFQDDSLWVNEFRILSISELDTAYVKTENNDLILYSKGYASCYSNLIFNDWGFDVFCIEIGFKKFTGQYYPWGATDGYLITSTFEVRWDDSFFYRDKYKSDLFLDSRVVHIKIDRVADTFEIYRNDDTDISFSFTFSHSQDSSIQNRIKFGTQTDGINKLETIVDYVILYTTEPEP